MFPSRHSPWKEWLWLPSSHHLPQHAHNVFFEFGDLGLDLLQWPRRHVFVEMPRQWNLVSHPADLAVLLVAHVFADPGVWHVRPDFAVEIRINVFLERYVFVIAQLRIGFGIAVGVTANLGCLVAFGERCEDGLAQWSTQLDIALLEDGFQISQEAVAVLVGQAFQPDCCTTRLRVRLESLTHGGNAVRIVSCSSLPAALSTSACFPFFFDLERF